MAPFAFLVFLLFTRTDLAIAQEPSFRWEMSEACEKYLAPRWSRNAEMVSKTVVGHGRGWMLTPSELAIVSNFAPILSQRLDEYAQSSRHHRAAFLLLPESARLTFGTRASTLADNPTRYLAFSTDSAWLAVNLRQSPDVTPQHLVIMSSAADVFAAFHEVVHLKDYDQVFEFAQARGKPYILRMDVFRVLTEFHAYQAHFRSIRDEDSSSAPEAAAGLSKDLYNQISGDIFRLDPGIRLKVESLTGLKGQELGDYHDYLVNGPAFPSWSEILSQLGHGTFEEYKE